MTQEKEYQICTRCVMDTTDRNITFDENGVCNHCHDYEDLKKELITDPIKRQQALEEIIAQVKRAGKDKEYDCIIGVSGGVDSSYVAYLAKEWGLRGLLVHLDNGWDSELAVKNIENIVEYTGFDLYTLVIDWEEFKDLQRSFFRADVIDLELLSDHAIFATLNNLAARMSVKFILNGGNFSTESILPKSWKWHKTDELNIKSIHKKFGEIYKIKTYPYMSTLKKVIQQYILGIKSISILNYLDFNKKDAINVITNQLGWINYGGKHHESVFTRFYQGFILPKKFNVDKRRAHLSSLINSEQISRKEALLDLESDTYDSTLKIQDKFFVEKKLGVNIDNYIKRREVSHRSFKSDYRLYYFLKKLQSLILK